MRTKAQFTGHLKTQVVGKSLINKLRIGLARSVIHTHTQVREISNQIS